MFRDTQAFYDAIYASKDYWGEARKLDAIIRHAKRCQGTALLDVACGTGAHLVQLKRQYRVEGVDLDEGMLAIARKRVKGARFHRGNLRTFDLGRQFDAVVCLFSSIGYARTVPGLNNAISRMAAHTKPGGVVVVEPWITPENFGDGRSGVQTGEANGITVARAFRNYRRGRTSFLEFHYLVAADGQVHRIAERHELGLFTIEEYTRAFKEAGLRVRFYKRGLTGRGLFVGIRALPKR
jgi:SAM-dependent methyltransferase